MIAPPMSSTSRLVSRLGGGRQLAVDAVLLLAGLGVALLLVRHYLNPHDEGLVLQAAARMGDGDVPYRDFWWNYGPGQPLLLALLDRLPKTEPLMTWRLVRATEDAFVAWAAYRLVLRETTQPWALGAWAATVVLMVVVRLPNPNATCAALVLLSLLLATRWPVAAGIAAGIVTLFRPELGLVALACVLIAAAPTARARAALAWLAASVVTLLPFAILAGPWAIVDSTFGFDLTVQPDQRLAFPLVYDLDFEAGTFLHFYLPALLMAGLALALLGLAVIRPLPRIVALAPLGLAGAAYLVGRADVYHLVPIVAAVPAMLAVVAAKTVRAGRARTALGVACAAVLVLFTVDGVLRRIDFVSDAPAVAGINIKQARWIQTFPGDVKETEQLRVLLDQRYPPRAPIFLANARHDDVRAGVTLMYVLMDRPNPTRYDVMQPGVVTRADVQREIVDDLRRTRAPVVRWMDPSGAAREKGSRRAGGGATILDQELATQYDVVATTGPYQLLERR